MKKKLFYISVLVICLAILSGGTLAYYNATDTARNVITSGAVNVRVVEYQSNGGQLQPYPSQPIQVMPGAAVSKIVSVESLDQDAWVRMNYKLTILDAEGNEKNIDPEELAAVILIHPDADNWIWLDGWWYYKTAIGAGAQAAPLFETVSFSGPKMGNQYQNCTLLIDVTAQAVQQANNGTTVLEALGWPEN